MNNKFLCTLIASFLLIISMVYADPVGGGTTYVGSSSGINTTTTQLNITAGNLTSVNVSGTQQTTRWGGFWGNISGGIILSDVGSNQFYAWTLTNVSNAVVYASNGTVSSWGAAILAANYSVQPSNLKNVAASDNFTNTFTTNEAFTSTTLNIAAANYTYTRKSGGSSTLKTYALMTTGGNTLIYAGKAINDETGFNGQAVDYQILVPANSTGVTYNFYLELP